MSTAEDQSKSPIIVMRDVSVSALKNPDEIVLENVDWTVLAGQYWVLGGLHGSGKSDLMSLAAGIMPPVTGSYELFGHPMPMYDPKLLSERLRLGLVFETGQVLHQLTVKENISLPLHYHRSDLEWRVQEERVKEMLELTELTPFAKQMSGSIGRAWQKRVGLARALMLEPELLILDQPLSGLDLRHAAWWIRLLKKMFSAKTTPSGRPLTVILTAEDMRPWKNEECHFAVLKEKKLLTLGQLKAMPENREPLIDELMDENVSFPE